jgi:WD40 repeat protein
MKGIRIITFTLVCLASSAAEAKNFKEFTTPQEKPLNIQYVDKLGLAQAALDFLDTDKMWRTGDISPQYGACRTAMTIWRSMQGHYVKDPATGQMYHNSGRAQPQLSPDGLIMASFDSHVEFTDIGTGTRNYVYFTMEDASGKGCENMRALSWGRNSETLYLYGTNGTFKATKNTNGVWKEKKLEGVNGYVQESADGKMLYWEDWDCTVWRYDVGTQKSEVLARNAVEINLHGDYLYFHRNSEVGISEIWRINVLNGQEQKLLSSSEHGFSSPQVSKDGKYIAVMGNTLSPYTKKQNLDIFIARTDGTGLRQLTDHPANDEFPIWSIYGNKIYFLSQRRIDGSKYNEYSGGWLYSMDIKQVLEEMK